MNKYKYLPSFLYKLIGILTLPFSAEKCELGDYWVFVGRSKSYKWNYVRYSQTRLGRYYKTNCVLIRNMPMSFYTCHDKTKWIEEHRYVEY